MALQASGSISASQISNEFGLPPGRNLGAYRVSQSVGSLANLPLDADIEYITTHHIDTSKFPEKDPDYVGWGKTMAGVNYIELIPYLIKSVQENNELINSLMTKVDILEKYINDNK